MGNGHEDKSIIPRTYDDLKSEYLMDENPHDLWNSLKERYEQQNAAEKHDELLLKNHHQRPTGTAPLPEVNSNVQNTKRFDSNKRRPKNFKGRNNHIKKQKFHRNNKGKSIFNNKDKSDICRKCGCYSHTTKKCHTPKHLVDLYLKSVGRSRPTQGKRFEAHFNLQSDTTKTTSCSQNVHPELNNDITLKEQEDLEGMDNMLVDFASNDLFGDFD
ncbi:uncharacterized protein LOC133889602 [Phragmites australis]|uniref:uncharacterized protein LOC133889602 n=1 Tax=Phragmites australis TaxID=29695 RepID=UPI002D773271|nr:uncharacterized protein LOC133889602 [Phragmites australis]